MLEKISGFFGRVWEKLSLAARKRAKARKENRLGRNEENPVGEEEVENDSADNELEEDLKRDKVEENFTKDELENNLKEDELKDTEEDEFEDEELEGEQQPKRAAPQKQ